MSDSDSDDSSTQSSGSDGSDGESGLERESGNEATPQAGKPRSLVLDVGARMALLKREASAAIFAAGVAAAGGPMALLQLALERQGRLVFCKYEKNV